MKRRAGGVERKGREKGNVHPFDILIFEGQTEQSPLLSLLFPANNPVIHCVFDKVFKFLFLAFFRSCSNRSSAGLDTPSFQTSVQLNSTAQLSPSCSQYHHVEQFLNIYMRFGLLYEGPPSPSCQVDWNQWRLPVMVTALD